MRSIPLRLRFSKELPTDRRSVLTASPAWPLDLVVVVVVEWSTFDG
jgi:hypothetical protein